jgi:hypothetical protein
MPRNWSTKTLARELIRFLKSAGIETEATVGDLLEALKSRIVADEVGEDLVL